MAGNQSASNNPQQQDFSNQQRPTQPSQSQQPRPQQPQSDNMAAAVIKQETSDLPGSSNYQSLLTPWSTFFNSQSPGSYPFPSPGANGLANLGDNYMSWNADPSMGGFSFGSTGLTPGWQMSGMYPGGPGWSMDAERGLVNMLRRSSLVEEDDGLAKIAQQQAMAASAAAAAATTGSSGVTSGSTSAPASGSGTPAQADRPTLGEQQEQSSSDSGAHRPSALPLQRSAAQSAGPNSSDDLSTVPALARSSQSSMDSSNRGSFDSLPEAQLRRASHHQPRHIVDLSAGYNGIHNYAGFGSGGNNYPQTNTSQGAFMSIDPMQAQSQYGSQSYFPQQPQHPNFPSNNSQGGADMRQSLSNSGANPVMTQARHRESRESVSSISPAMLNRAQQQHVPSGQTNMLLGSPASVHSHLSDDHIYPISRSNSDAGVGPVRDHSPAGRRVSVAPGAGASGSSSRHPYMEDYARRHLGGVPHGTGAAASSSSSRAVSPGGNRPGKKTSLKSKRASMDQLMAMDDSDDDDEAHHDIPEGIEKDGMMWGMKTEDYRALSARERKRVRNRISARTFRARRKEHLNDLESGLAERNQVLKAAQDTIKHLTDENSELRKRLAKYESI